MQTQVHEMPNLYHLARPLLFTFDPETAHEVTLKSLERGLYLKSSNADPECLQVGLAGLEFPNPVGIAAGFDKDARVPDAVLGFGRHHHLRDLRRWSGRPSGGVSGRHHRERDPGALRGAGQLRRPHVDPDYSLAARASEAPASMTR